MHRSKQAMAEIIKVFIIEDSALSRQMITEALESDPQIKVIGTAADPYIAAQKLSREAPDVITLDIVMPRMDGITFLRKLMSQHPLPVVVISSLTKKSSETAMKALEYGAVEVMAKPHFFDKQSIEEAKIRLIDRVKAASLTSVSRKVHPTHDNRQNILPVKPRFNADAVLPPQKISPAPFTCEKVIAIGASTGGTEAIRQLLSTLPVRTPGIVIVQHMPEVFTRSFADRLNQLCDLSVKEAEPGDVVQRGHVLIAPGNRHMILRRTGSRYTVDIMEGPLVSRHRPSVDVLFRSVARYAGRNSIGVLLTGMGDDGAKGLLEMQQAGAHTIAQDEKSCVVFGMPKEAIKLGAADKVLSLDLISRYMLSLGTH